MVSALFSAIGKGYTAKTILNHIAEKFPKSASGIHNAYVYGYTANQILSRMASKKDKKHYDPDQFLTEHEKVQNRDLEQKKKAGMQVIGALAAAGAVTAGAYALYRRNRPPKVEILPALKGKQKPRQLSGPEEPKRLPYISRQAEQKEQPLPPQTIQPVQSREENQMPSQTAQPDFSQKSVDLIKNLKEDTRFKNIIEGGYEAPITAGILRNLIPKNILSVLEKSEGGLEQLVKDYTGYLKETTKEQPIQQEQKGFESPIQQSQSLRNPEQQMSQEIFENKQRKAEQDLSPIAPLTEGSSQVPEISTRIESKPLVSLKNGQVGEVESIKNGVASVNVNGQTKKEKVSNVSEEPRGIEDAVRDLINKIPEGMKSTALQSMVHIPGMNTLLTQFYDGKWAWYLDVPEDLYQSIALGTYEPKGQSVTGIGEYKPGVADSRGSGFHNEIKINPKYSKENKGVTWGYATNEYALFKAAQDALHKISKEKYDQQGNLIVPKKRSKKST